MLYLHTSNQLEQLATQYARITNEPLKKVFEPEIVVVQNSGMARYLAMHVADISGISANTQALFPAEFMWKLLRIVSPDVSKQSECSPDALRFHIMEALIEHAEDYPEIQHYIINKNSQQTENSKQVDELSTWDISGELSQLLDQYLFYRSEWIRDWEAGDIEESNWQARLWNRCVKDKNLTHWLTLQDQFKDKFDTINATDFPERVSFFSMSALSPGYLDLLGVLAKKIDIHLYIINPCEDIYWGDISSEKKRAKLPLEKQDYVDVGNPLLASMGTQGRDFLDQLLSVQQIEKNTIESFNTSTTENLADLTLLNKLQNDIFNLEQPELLNNHEYDNSITFNACHTAMREVEVLHDQILNTLDNDSTLTPADIVVMMPDIEKYAPYIEAIFSSPVNQNTKQKLPFSIADRNPLSVEHMIDALHKILLLNNTRFDVESVFEILNCDEIREHFNLDENQVYQCRKLAKSTNIRWGINANYRKQNDLPETSEHTWKYALDNLLLGYALGEIVDMDGYGSAENLFKSQKVSDLPLLAYHDIEGSDAVMLADFKRFTDTVFKINQWSHQSLSLLEWLDKTKKLISQLFSENTDYELLLKPLDNIKNTVTLTEFEKEISFNVFQKLLIETLQNISGTEKYLGHGITFCALVPMRSVPFKIVALMGMNDGEYPRQDKRHSFDLMAGKPRKGDRSRRDEDRYLFLESILATRSKLLISYTGQSVLDNSILPPSVLVSELLDTLAIYTGQTPDSFICHHPLQAFSSLYFGNDNSDKKLFSYAREYLKIHEEKVDTSHTKITEPFISKPLEALDNGYKHLTLDDLITFYQNPARAFLKQRFSIQTFDEDITLPIREPFEIESFKDREVRELIMPCEEGLEERILEAKQVARAKGLLPYGEIGDAVFNHEKQVIETFKAQLPDNQFEDIKHILLEYGDFRLEGSFNKLTNTGLVFQQVTSPYYRDYIALWISHLMINTQLQTPTTFYSPDVKFTLSVVENADELLGDLLDFYWQGLHFPLSFFPKSGFAMYKDKGIEDKNKASKAWLGDNQKAGEIETFEHWLLHRNTELNFSFNDKEPENSPEDNFLTISQFIYGKMFEHLSEI